MVLMRVIGRRELSSLQPFDLILLIVLGDAVQQDGEPVERNLKRERLTLDELAESVRQEGIERLADVKWAVSETTGKISFIQKES